jgi:hypothetical protein
MTQNVWRAVHTVLWRTTALPSIVGNRTEMVNDTSKTPNASVLIIEANLPATSKFQNIVLLNL